VYPPDAAGNNVKTVTILRHVADEGPGYLADVLERNGIPFRVVAIDRGERVPEHLEQTCALVLMGGGMSANDALPWIEQELQLIRAAAARGLPVLGHCLGGQLIAKALGGSVGPNPVKEIGWLPVERIDNGGARDWLMGLPARFECFHWHGETFTLPPGATPILRSHACANQGFVREKILALQCHIEMTAEMVVQWAEHNADEIARPSPTVQTMQQMCEDLPARIDALQGVAERIYTRWLRGF
jgi:GMP synthase-like glutamine amidotransferase